MQNRSTSTSQNSLDVSNTTVFHAISRHFVSIFKEDVYFIHSFYRKPNLLNMQKISWFSAFFHTQFFRFDLKMSFSLVRYQTADISSQGFNSEFSDMMMKEGITLKTYGFNQTIFGIYYSVSQIVANGWTFFPLILL